MVSPLTRGDPFNMFPNLLLELGGPHCAEGMRHEGRMREKNWGCLTSLFSPLVKNEKQTTLNGQTPFLRQEGAQRKIVPRHPRGELKLIVCAERKGLGKWNGQGWNTESRDSWVWILSVLGRLLSLSSSYLCILNGCNTQDLFWWLRK